MKKHLYNQPFIQSPLYRPGRFLFVYFLVFIFSYGVLAYFDFLPSNTGTVAPVSDLMLLGIIAGILQLLGYILYIRNPEIDPNPVTWFMFAYGTGILAILEWDASATLPELFLPITCALFSIYVSYRCWVKSHISDPTHFWPHDWWPEDAWERWSFISDMAITLGYIAAWALATWAILTPEYKNVAVLAFLFLSNISTFPSFYPLMRETYLHPDREDSMPWAVWAAAYGVLAFVTYKTHGAFFHPLMFYPVSNVFLHGFTAWLARPSAKNKKACMVHVLS